MIRLILVVILIIAFMIYSIFSAIVNYIVKQVDPMFARRMTHTVIKVLFTFIKCISGVRVHVTGIENLDEKEPLFIIANHRGFFDVITGFCLLKRPCGIVAKDYFKKIPFLSYWMKRIDCFFLDRKDLRSGVTMIIDSVEKIKNGISIWLFPEGTRNRNEDPYTLLDFKAGAFKIAEKSESYILPIAFYGTEKIFEKHIPRITSGDVYINIGKPYKISELSENDRQDIGVYSRNVVTNLLKEIKHD